MCKMFFFRCSRRSLELLKDVGDSIFFLKRTYTRVSDGIVVKLGNYIQKMLEAFEEHFCTIRVQQVPADSGIQVKSYMDLTPQSTVYRSIQAWPYTLHKRDMTSPTVSRSLPPRW